MGRDNSTVTLDTKVTIGTIIAVFAGVYWLIMLGARVDANEKDQAELRATIVKRLDDISAQQSALALDVASIQARVDLLIEWSEMKRKRTNPGP